MDKKEIKRKASEMLNAGKPKSEVFKALSGGSVKDNQLAFFIASHPNHNLYEEHYKKVNGLISIMFLQALFTALLGFGIGSKIGPTAAWVVAALCALIPLLFAFGFYKNHAGTYNAFILLTIIQFPNMVAGITQTPIVTGIGIAIGLSILGYAWYVRSLLFPDFTFITPKKIKGQYVFSS
jgi:hypothetical protein